MHYTPGFKYKFPESGVCILGKADQATTAIKKKVNDSSISIIATVKRGPIGVTELELAEIKRTEVMKVYTAPEVVSSFKAMIEADSKQGRVRDIKTSFEEKEYELGNCLLFSQIGKDNGTMPIANFGKWCFNSKTYSYIFLSISARVGEGQNLPELNVEKGQFFDSLGFTAE